MNDKEICPICGTNEHMFPVGGDWFCGNCNSTYEAEINY